MAALGLPVPPGFVVLPDALARRARRGADARLAARLAGCRTPTWPGRPRRRAARPRRPAGRRARGVAAEAYAGLGDDAPVACARARSRRTPTTASYAGQQDTFLHVRGAGRVATRVRDCWASLFGERALYYRSRKGASATCAWPWWCSGWSIRTSRA
jgi:pyruvate,water dikinase